MAPRFSELLGGTEPPAVDAGPADAEVVEEPHEPSPPASEPAQDQDEASIEPGHRPNPFTSLAAEQARRLDSEQVTNERLRAMGLDTLKPVDDDLLPRD